MADMNKEELYQLAVDMMNDNNNTELTLLKTAETFEMLGDYKNSQELALKCLEKADDASKNSTYEIGIKKMQDNEISSYEEAIELFNKITDWKDASEQIVICKRKIEEIKENEKKERIEKEQRAKKASKRKKLIAATFCVIVSVTVAFVTILNTKIIPQQKYTALVEKYGQESIDRFYSIEVGDTYKIGSFEQDNNTSNGKEEIEWIVIDKKETTKSLLLVSKYALDVQYYKPNSLYDKTSHQWEGSPIRTWLNGTFYDNAFDDEEKKLIENTYIKAHKARYSRDNFVSAGNSTRDKVFLLTTREAEKCFDSDYARQCSLTPYAKSRIPSEFYKGGWWLRSTGFKAGAIAYVQENGSISNIGNYAWEENAVRPAIWLDISNLLEEEG